MKSLVLVILCGVVALSFFSKSGDALTTEAPNVTEEVETSYPPPKFSLDDVDSDNTSVTLDVILTLPPEIANTREEYEYEDQDEEIIYPLYEAEDRRFGNGVRMKTSQNYIMTTQFRKVSLTSGSAGNGGDKEVKRQKIKRRKTNNANRPKPLQKNKKGEKNKRIKIKKKKRIGNKQVVRKKEKLGVGKKVKKDAEVVVAEPEDRKNKKKRCRPKRSCKRVSGTCKKKCHKKKETESSTGTCKGKKCKCCVDKPKTCKQKGVCVGFGTCRKSCQLNEIRADYLSCAGKKCMCCVPDEGPCGPESLHDECKLAGGTCKDKCDGDRVVADLCPASCSCCIPEIQCDNTDTCKVNGGTCKSVCLDTEVLLPGNCGKAGCRCCGPPPTECTQTPTCPGTCSSECKGVISLEDHCLGPFCLCCLDCSPKSACQDAGGNCKSLCGCGEKELEGACNGGGCKCCVADVLECKDNPSASCPNCMYTPLCTADHGPLQSCSSQKGCSCC